MGASKSKFVPDINQPLPLWNRPNFPPIISVYDDVNLDFRPIEGQRNTWKYDLPRLLAVFQGWGIREIISIERQTITVNDDVEYYDKQGWTSNILDKNFYEDYSNEIVAVYYRSNDNMYGGNLLIDSELSGIPYPRHPIQPSLIEVKAGRCIILRGDIRHKIQNWRRYDSQRPGFRECFIITAR